jgi:hypothetical protein
VALADQTNHADENDRADADLDPIKILISSPIQSA